MSNSLVNKCEVCGEVLVYRHYDPDERMWANFCEEHLASYQALKEIKDLKELEKSAS